MKIDFVLKYDLFFNEIFVNFVDHSFRKERTWDLMMKVVGMGRHKEFSDGLAMTFGDDDSEGLCMTVLFGVDVKTCFDDRYMTRRE